ncbi:hypothetical protein JVT61DRAFT_10353 [Boletus reticuloceps]|uniref:Uncharacterized protein n=1 Tax=Boletus reticuloceps TaxID=495285 RepID=A0A8I3AC10_9AGAM|nr:hypothetical protein JVT61DRAFT_10353 [Boletus reticuloceps]
MASRGSGQGSTAHKQAQSQALSAPSARGTRQIGHCGRGNKPQAAAAGPSTHAQPAPPVIEPPKKMAINIVWEASRTNLLIVWIMGHEADRHILFHDRSSSATMSLPGDKPSGKTKKDVAGVITKHIFTNDSDHAEWYMASDPAKYTLSVLNCLATLKSNYCEQRKRFTSTGGGIVPRGNDDMEDVLRVFPYYGNLDSIWNGIPSFDPQLISSKPNNDHTASFLNVVTPRSNINASSAEDSPGILDDLDIVKQVNDAPAGQATDLGDVAMDDIEWDKHTMNMELLPKEAPRVRYHQIIYTC